MKIAQTTTNKIINPVLNPEVGANPSGGDALARVMGALFNAIVMMGGLAVLLYFALGGITWITAGGDSGKIEEAKNRITGAIVGMAILVGVVALAMFLNAIFGYDLLNPIIPNTASSGGSI